MACASFYSHVYVLPLFFVIVDNNLLVYDFMVYLTFYVLCTVGISIFFNNESCQKSLDCSRIST